jgi:hypothetical protein
VEPTIKLREVVGSAICVAAFSGLVYCAVQHGMICSDLPGLNAQTGNTIVYSCKGQIAYVTSSQKRLIHGYSFLFMLIGYAGYFLARRKE